jgi:hypothetical protein
VEAGSTRGERRGPSERLPRIGSRRTRVVSADELSGLADALGSTHRWPTWAHYSDCAGARWLASASGGLISSLARAKWPSKQRVASTAAPCERTEVRGRTASPVGSWRAARHARCPPCPRGLTGAEADAFVFVSPRGGPLDYSRWRRRVWLPACERAGLEGLVFHACAVLLRLRSCLSAWT